MAGHWIPWEVGLERKREVLRIARRMKIRPLEAAAACMTVWAWASDQSTDGLVPGLTVDDVSAAVGVDGIGEAMRSEGWLVADGGAVQFPNWDRFNSRSARARMYAAERKRRERVRQRDNNVTGA